MANECHQKHDTNGVTNAGKNTIHKTTNGDTNMRTYTVTVKFKVNAPTKKSAENFIYTQLCRSPELNFLPYTILPDKSKQ